MYASIVEDVSKVKSSPSYMLNLNGKHSHLLLSCEERANGLMGSGGPSSKNGEASPAGKGRGFGSRRGLRRRGRRSPHCAANTTAGIHEGRSEGSQEGSHDVRSSARKSRSWTILEG